MSLLRKYYSVNTLQYIIVVHYLVHNFCAVLMSVDSNDILYNSMHDALTPGYLWWRRHHCPSRQVHCMMPSYLLFINQETPGYIKRLNVYLINYRSKPSGYSGSKSADIAFVFLFRHSNGIREQSQRSDTIPKTGVALVPPGRTDHGRPAVLKRR